jgi:hypothetical protein
MNDNTDAAQAFTELADKIKKAAYAEGFRDALSAVAKAVGELAPGEFLEGASGPTKVVLNMAAGSGKSSLTMGTTPYYIVGVLKATPGLTPAEIIQALQDSGHKAPENSIRTNIHRLKERKLIVARHGKWFAV